MHIVATKYAAALAVILVTCNVKVIETAAEPKEVETATLYSAAAVNAEPQSTTTWQLEGRFNFLVGIAMTASRYENVSLCGQELGAFLKAAASKELWSLKVLDSFGHMPRSFNWGNYFWFSSPQLCTDLNTPYSITFANQQTSASNFNVTSPFKLRFSMIYLKFATPHYIYLQLPFENFIHLGLCLPDSCSLKALLNYTNLYFERNIFLTQRDFKLKLIAFEARAPSFNWHIFKSTGSVICITISLLLILLILVAELLFKYKKSVQNEHQMHAKISTITFAKATTLLQQTQPVAIQHEKSSKMVEILLCFRLGENYKRTLKLENSKNFLTVIAGLRTVICLWVTVFHVYYYSLYAMANTPLIFAKLEQFILQPVMQACFYVDIFFVISAFLLVYHFLSNESQMQQIHVNNFMQNMKLFGKIIFHRYMRLTPIMAVTMIFSDIMFDLLNMYSPFRMGAHSGIYCKHNWWYNLLYIHNLQDMQNICCSWTWYLGCEMQFFILFTVLLFIHAKNAYVGKIVFGTLALGFVVIAWFCNYHNGITFQIDAIHSTLNQLYVKPWVRINPYVGGAAIGWLLHHYRQQKLQQEQQQGLQQQQHLHYHINKDVELRVIWRVAFWLFCTAVYVATNFMSYWRSTPSWLVSLIMSFGKLCFAFCIGAVIVVCALGYGGLFNALLSARVFLFLNKFCFSIYMIAPVIVIAVFGLRNEATNFTEVASTMDFFGIVLLSILVAFLMVLLVELPMQRITNALLGSKKHK